MPEPNIDYSLYTNVIQSNLFLSPNNWTFKSDPAYRDMLEHVSVDLGNQYIKQLQTSDIYNNNSTFLHSLCYENDKFGQPVKHLHSNYVTCSPTNFRYIYHSFLILEHMQSTQSNDVDVVEIGGGYGGLCFFVYKIAPLFNITIRSYTIYDLPAPMQLQKQYTSLLNVDANVNSSVPPTNAFLISNYAFSEINETNRKMYETIVIPGCTHGFLAWNFIDVYRFTDKPLKVIPETPLTGSRNYYVYF